MSRRLLQTPNDSTRTQFSPVSAAAFPGFRFKFGFGFGFCFDFGLGLGLGSMIEAEQFIQRCEAWNSREQKHTRRAAHMDVRRAPPGQDVPCGACPRLHRSWGPLIHKKAFFFGYLSFVALDKRK
ncbi:hypothetical protein [Lysobacter capsici]|uniref:hypothetical protein n=1 Tax=Lysobacter capsici TaxID=435897 RepID=UPI0011E008AC|nr:hypothetical protein [Lysobacter capsici]